MLIETYSPKARLEYYEHRWDDGKSLGVYVAEVETDAEYEERIAIEARDLERINAHDLKEFERLKAKFG
jgi:hypothetical protein